jgi:hypothetical protein
MKEALTICLFSSILLGGAPEALAKPHAHRKKHVALSAPKPVAALEVAVRPAEPPPDGAKRPSYWLAADPHVPLAVVDTSGIHSVGRRGKECGAASRWASPRSHWHAVDAWGRLTGLYEVSGSEPFDVTACHEVSFTARAGKPGIGLFVSDDSGYTPRESVAYTPSIPEKKRFDRFLRAMESSWVNQKPLGKAVPSDRRSLFFQFSMPKDPIGEGRLDGAGKPIERPRRWAVAGGPILVVAYLGENGHWKAARVLSPLGLADSYTPVAVFDMNGDGVPEIVVRESDGPTFADKVLSLAPETLSWEEAAESPGGGAL